MDILSPELVWIGQRCYRVNVPASSNHATKNNRPERTFNYEDVDDDEGYECTASIDKFDCEEDHIEELAEGRFQSKIHCPQVFHSHVIGAKGSTKKRLEQENRVQINVPKMGSGDKIILIKGFNKQDIASARKSIASIVSSGRSKQDITHFVSVPCSTDEIRANFVKFRESILHDWHPGLDMKLFQKPEKLHFTLEVVVLLDEIDRSAAIEVFNECEQSIIKRILNGAQLNLRVEGIDIMNDDPSAANVLYAHCRFLNIHCKQWKSSKKRIV